MDVDPGIWSRAEAVLASGTKVALATTGGGSQLLTWLLNHPGASRAVIEAQVPYSTAALQDYLGSPGPHRVEEETARSMAARAFARARGLSGDEHPVIGVGCTAALATSRRRRGQDRASIVLRTPNEYWFHALHFDQGPADRLDQENALSRVALRALAAACQGLRPVGAECPDRARVAVRVEPVQTVLEGLLMGAAPAIQMGADGDLSFQLETRSRLVFPGSFNPLHEGHVELAAVAEAQSGRPAWLEISVENVDKPPLTYAEVNERLQPLRGRYRVVVTRAATFVEKARICPGSWFVIGYDTLVRLVDARYYAEGEGGVQAALAEMAALRCRFLVAGRLHQGCYRTLAAVALPEPCRCMFEMIPEDAFRCDVSSTEIRATSPGSAGCRQA